MESAHVEQDGRISLKHNDSEVNSWIQKEIEPSEEKKEQL